MWVPTRTNSTCLCEPPGVFQETDGFLETGSKTLASHTTPSHKKSHYLAHRLCPGQDNFFPDRYVLRFGELSLWTGHREKFLAALKIEKTPLLLWVSPPPPSLLRSNSTSAGQLNFSSYQLPWRRGGSINTQVLYTPKIISQFVSWPVTE